MFDLRPVLYVIGLCLAVLGATMLVPMLVDLQAGNGHHGAFLQSALITILCGGVLALACANGVTGSLTLRQAFVLATGTWTLLPLFGALPFLLGATAASLTDAYFEAVSGLTTTGATVFVGLDRLPDGLHLWRGLLNWLGGLGFVLVALIFFPVMRVGGLQYFRKEGFAAQGRILPRVIEVARALLLVYGLLTLACIGVYLILGMSTLDAVTHAFSTISTGGFSTRDASFAGLSPALHYAGAGFMILASLPYLRFAQLFSGTPAPLFRDPQVRAFLLWLFIAVGAVTLWRIVTSGQGVEESLRMALFDLSSVMSGTGFHAGSLEGWGAFAVLVAIVLGLIGGCTSSTSGALGVFRVLIMASAIRNQIARIHTPHRVLAVRYGGQVLDDEVIGQVMLYSCGYVAALVSLSLAMTLTGVDSASAVFAVWTSIGNIGFGLGPLAARTGTMTDYPDAAKWLMILAMVIGRLGLLSIVVMVSARFWRR